MTRIAFTVQGKPKGKGRPRYSKTGRPFTPGATVKAEKAIAWEFVHARRMRAVELGRDIPIMTGTVSLSIVATFDVPKSWGKGDRAAALAGEIEYTGKPDRDNIEKLVADALNGVAWMDDAQVAKGPPVVRRYGMGERIEVVVEEIEAQGRKSPAERRREAKRDNPERYASSVKKRAEKAPRASVEHAISIGKRIRK